jgi:hypothetical protein
MGEKGNAADAADDLVTTGAAVATGFVSDVATGTATGLTKDAAVDAIQRRRDEPPSADAPDAGPG